MAAYVSVPRDLTKVKTKLVFNLTKRQLICFGIGIVIALPVYLLTHKIIGVTAGIMLMIIIMLPFFFLGMYEKDGMPLETIIKHYIYTNVLRPHDRPYQTECSYANLPRHAQVYKEVSTIAGKKESSAKAAPPAAKQRAVSKQKVSANQSRSTAANQNHSKKQKKK